jgi:hypothetical protein
VARDRQRSAIDVSAFDDDLLALAFGDDRAFDQVLDRSGPRPR